jgi:hypothetical protein
MNSKKTPNHSPKRNLSTIKCTCGHEILLLPDTKTMGQVIEKHALEHKKKYALTGEETNALMDTLISQVFKLARDSSRNKK